MEKKLRTIFIVDIGNTSLDQNKLFDRVYANEVSHTLLPICLFSEKATRAGYECITPDIFLAQPEAYAADSVFLISQLTSNRTGAILAHPFVVPLILLCQESPYIATRFYLSLRNTAKRFVHNMLFSGMQRTLAKNTSFFEMHFPILIDKKCTIPKMPFSEKKDIVLIAGNKNITNHWKGLVIKLFYGFSVRPLYSFRKKLIENLAARNIIEIYGRGWEKENDTSVHNAYKGPVASNAKYMVMAEYKYALCFENAVFPGYITEKIFDAFLAGVVPIYMGAPDVEYVIPADTFIDMRMYTSTEALASFLNTLDEATYEKYLSATARYLSSDAFKVFSAEHFTNSLLTFITSYEK